MKDFATYGKRLVSIKTFKKMLIASKQQTYLTCMESILEKVIKKKTSQFTIFVERFSYVAKETTKNTIEKLTCFSKKYSLLVILYIFLLLIFYSNYGISHTNNY